MTLPAIPWPAARYAIITSAYALRTGDQSVHYHIATPAFLKVGLFAYGMTLCRDALGSAHAEREFIIGAAIPEGRRLCPKCAAALRELAELAGDA